MTPARRSTRSRATAPASSCAARTTRTSTSRRTSSSGASTTSRWRAGSPELGLAGLRAEVALHLDRRARRGSSAAPCPGSTRLGDAHAQPRGRRDEPARGRDRGARGRADRVVADGRLARRERRSTRSRRRPGGKVAGVGALRARAARAGVAPRAGPGRRRARRAAARDATRCSTSSRATSSCSRPATWPATRSSPSSTRAVEAGVETIVVTHPEFPSQDLVGRGSGALAERGALLERCFTTPHTGKVHVGAASSTAIRAIGAGAHRCSRPTSARSSTRRSRTAWR